MIFTQISFGPHAKSQYDDAEFLIHSYLGSLLHNGQIGRHYEIVPWQGQVVAYVNALGLGADRLRSHSCWGKEELKKIEAFFGRSPLWAANEDFPPKYKATWKNAPFLYLMTHFCDDESPLCRGDRNDVIPLFRVPITDQERDNAFYWLTTYRELDNIWIGSRELEMQAYRVLADPDSELSKTGRELCQAIEKATGVPTYYYLMRYHGREFAEEKKRRCPGCGKPWAVKQPKSEDDSKKTFREFDFQCEKCRLVSHCAPDINLRYAKIGEPKKIPKQNKSK